MKQFRNMHALVKIVDQLNKENASDDIMVAFCEDEEGLLLVDKEAAVAFYAQDADLGSVWSEDVFKQAVSMGYLEITNITSLEKVSVSDEKGRNFIHKGGLALEIINHYRNPLILLVTLTAAVIGVLVS